MRMDPILAAAQTGLLAVRAEVAPGDDPVLTAIKDLRASYDARFQELEAHLNDEARINAARLLNGGPAIRAVDSEYTRNFENWVTRGAHDAEAELKAANGIGDRAKIQAAMSSSDASSGGYIAPVEWDRKIQKALRNISPIRRIAKVIATGQGAYSTVWSGDTWGSGWVGETASRPATTTPTLSQIKVPAGEIYANPAITQTLLDDTELDLEDWVSTNLADEFARQEGIAFISGGGGNKPMGILQYAPGGIAATGLDAHPGGTLGVTPSGHATTIPNTDILVDFKYGLGAQYRQNSTWLMNSQTAGTIAKMKDGQGNYIWRESLLVSEPSTLLGRPVEIDENMPGIGAGNFPIAFGDFDRGYLINDRIGIRVLRDPYTNKPFVHFYTTKRVGGGLLDNSAIRLLKIAVS